MSVIRVLFLAAEAEPLVKVGGLGDVAGSLPKALQRLSPKDTDENSIDIRLVLPFHSAIRKKVGQAEFLFNFEVPARGRTLLAQAFQVEANGVRTYLIAGEPIDHDTHVYSPDPAIDGMKYIFFSLAALELAKKLDWKPDILHANDWHTALAVYSLRLRESKDIFFQDCRSVLTIHNLPFMGVGTEAAFSYFGLPASRYPGLPGWARSLPLPLGLQTADRIVAVSQTYAEEILTPEFGCGLETFLKIRHKSISGIVNGLDQETWDPASDPHIPARFDAEHLSNRNHNRIALIEEFDLNPDPTIPLLIMISRLDRQKGVDLILQGLPAISRLKWQAILLGTGDPVLEAACRLLNAKYPMRVRAVNRFDKKLSHRMYAGGDILMMPSRYEPCGLAQMMAMRYGCLPLAHATGGLKDTIQDVSMAGSSGTGFLFEPATADAFIVGLKRVINLFRNPKQWKEWQVSGMKQDFSWEKSAVKYFAVYQSIFEKG